MSEERKDNAKDPLILRCLKMAAAIDWRAMAIVVAALAGFGGAIWNRIDSVLERTLQGKTQQGVYELLATRLDELSGRIERIELEHLPAVPGPIKAKPAVPTPKRGALYPSPGSEAMTATGGLVEPSARSAKLPSFRQIQQSAQQDRMPELLENAASPR